MPQKPTYDELVERIARLENKLGEMERHNISIRRDAATTAPTSIEVGSLLLVDDAAHQRLYWQSPSGLVYFDGTAA
jgi:hypothetical protein